MTVGAPMGLGGEGVADRGEGPMRLRPGHGEGRRGEVAPAVVDEVAGSPLGFDRLADPPRGTNLVGPGQVVQQPALRPAAEAVSVAAGELPAHDREVEADVVGTDVAEVQDRL